MLTFGFTDGAPEVGDFGLRYRLFKRVDFAEVLFHAGNEALGVTDQLLGLLCIYLFNHPFVVLLLARNAGSPKDSVPFFGQGHRPQIYSIPFEIAIKEKPVAFVQFEVIRTPNLW